MPNIKTELERLRKCLLDLTTRNRLLSIPQHERAKIIRVEDELSDEVMRLLVKEKKKFSFLEKSKGGETKTAQDASSEGSALPGEREEDDVDERGIASRHRDTKLQTYLTSDLLQKRLLTFYHEARTAIEEQGVNTLYLALGQLKWRDDRSSTVERHAPLLLVSVELERTSAQDRFKLKVLDQDPSDNLSLSAKLLEFGIKMPPFEWEDNFQPTHYFESLKDSIGKQEGWEVYPNRIVLGFFSFAKFLMYRDLDPENWPCERSLDEHPIINGLVGEGFPPPEPGIPDDANLDKLIPVEKLDHVVDSDSSQAIAIEEVRANRNLIIQGPPGTGKSQTITNLIATAVNDGKRVLFVAEKLVALDVVKRRLEAHDLGPLVLELHSHKANKKTILEELKKTMELGRPKSAGHEELFGNLKKGRNALNKHAVLHNTPLEPCRMSPIQIIGKLSLLGEDGDPSRLPELALARDWTPEERIERENLILSIAAKIDTLGDPSAHTWRGVRQAVLTMFENEKIKSAVSELMPLLERLRSKCDELADAMHVSSPSNLGDTAYYLELASLVECAPELDKAAITSTEWDGAESRLKEVISSGQELTRIQAAYSGRLIEAAWAAEVTAIRMKLAAHGKSFFRFLNSGYRNAMAEFRAILKDPSPPKSLQERLAWLDDLLSAQKHKKMIDERNDLSESCFGQLYEREKSDWDKLSALVSWVERVKAAKQSAEFFVMFALIEDPGQCGNIGRELESIRDDVSVRLEKLFELLSLDLGEAFEVAQLTELDLQDIKGKLLEWVQHHEELSKWVDYRHLVLLAEEKGLKEIIEGLQIGKYDGGELSVIFNHAYYRQLYKQAVEAFPYLATFDGHTHNQVVEEFRNADKERIQAARIEILLKHNENLPSEGGMGAVGILKGEMNKKRGHMAIRKLLAKTGTATQVIKPVFMMSPLSVAQFLEPGTIDFDLVIFDEASQVEPVDALGAIARAKQVVVVGDEMQLPPTRFFARFASDDVEDEDEDDENSFVSAGDLESILGVAKAKGLPSKMLRWHYRSRHESLIAVSNAEFYGHSLFIIPSPHNDQSELGLKFHFVEKGIFDRGKSKKNANEARAVAEGVIQHAIDHPNRSLGVAAFSVTQRDAIIDELELLRISHPEAEAFFRKHPHEPFFVKNLENVQGDERDTILISVGYGKDPSGFFGMNFGPVGRDGGERRLNVLISRAKERCEVYASIRADDIDLNRAKKRGVAALKTFLQFAEKGILGVPIRETDREMDSPFEESVKKALEAEGCIVDHQVGTSGFFIDLAVQDPERPGRYVLGIECDGATYHSSRSARERDRQRQVVLEDHGWIIHRIWSTDWFRRPNEELKRCKKAIQEAMASGGPTTPHADQELPPPKVEREQRAESRSEVGSKVSGEAYVEAHFSVSTTTQIHEMESSQLAAHVMRVINTESPIHKDEVVSRIRECWGLKRAGSRIRDAVHKVINLLISDKEIRTEGEFVHILNGAIAIRDRSNVNSSSLKRPEHLPPSEIQAAILKLIVVSHGVIEEEVAFGVGRLFGFGSTSAQLRLVIESNIETLVKGDEIVHDGQYLRVKGNF